MRQRLVAEGKKEQTEGSKPMTAGQEGGSRFKKPDGQSIARLGPSSRSGNSFLVGNPNHLLRQKQNRKKNLSVQTLFLIPMYRKEFDACDMIAARIEEVLIEQLLLLPHGLLMDLLFRLESSSFSWWLITLDRLGSSKKEQIELNKEGMGAPHSS